MKRAWMWAWVLPVALFAAPGCGDDTNGDDGDGDGDTPETLDCENAGADLTTAQLFTDVVNVRCVSCHQPGAQGATSGQLELDTQAKLQAAVGKASIYAGSTTLKVAEANNPANSTMLLKVFGGSPTYTGPNGQNVGAKMPPGGLLPEAERQKFRQWLCNGAN